MRLLTFQGSYSYTSDSTMNGLVCFCHFESKDTKKKIEKVSEKIFELNKGKNIILVPFSHLYEDVMGNDQAEELFNYLGGELSKNKKINIKTAPFGVEKELHLDVEANDSAIKFFNF